MYSKAIALLDSDLVHFLIILRLLSVLCISVRPLCFQNVFNTFQVTFLEPKTVPITSFCHWLVLLFFYCREGLVHQVLLAQVAWLACRLVFEDNKNVFICKLFELILLYFVVFKNDTHVNLSLLNFFRVIFEMFINLIET